MMSRIDRIRRAALVRRAYQAEQKADDALAEATPAAALPVPVGPTRTFKDERPHGFPEVVAQMMGQAGERRGLRGGPTVLDTARTAYNRVEWSGSYDRRARKGGQARTDI